MSAEALGARLLAEVQEEGLDEFLAEIRQRVNLQKTDLLTVPPLDRLLELFSRAPPAQIPRTLGWSSHDGHESDEFANYDGTTTLARHHIDVVTSGRKSKATVIELTSPKSDFGKTHLLYYLTVLAILPTTYGGKESAVVWIDSDARFSVMRVREILLHFLGKQAPFLELSQMQSVVKDALQHLHVFRPQSSHQLIATLAILSGYLLDLKAHRSASRALKAIVLDSATAFYWQDRYAAELERLEAGPISARRVTPSSTKTAEAIKILKGLQKEFDCMVIFSTSPTSAPSSFLSRPGAITATPRPQQQGAPTPQEPARTSPWTQYAVMTLLLARVPVPQFALHMSLEDCLRDREDRCVAVSKGRFIVTLDWSNSDTWGNEVRDALAKMEGKGSFAMNIVAEGVDIDEA